MIFLVLKATAWSEEEDVFSGLSQSDLLRYFGKQSRLLPVKQVNLNHKSLNHKYRMHPTFHGWGKFYFLSNATIIKTTLI